MYTFFNTTLLLPIKKKKMHGWLMSRMVVAGTLGSLDSYITGSLRKWMYFLGDCMTIPTGWTLMVWLGSRNGTFLVKSFYSSLDCRRVEPFPHDVVWNS